MAIGGAERQLCLLAAEQVKRGNEVHVALVHGGPLLQRLSESGVVVHQLAARGNHDPAILFRIIWLVRKFQVQVVQSWLPQMDVFAGLASLLTRTPWLLSERCMAAAYEHRWKDKYLRSFIGRRAHAIVANSPAGLDYWKPQVQESVPLEIVANAVDFEAIQAAPPADVDQVNENEPLILFAGRLSEQKNVACLLNAIAILRSSVQVRAILCGEGPLLADVKALIEQLHLQDRVSVHGLRSDVWGVMKRAALFVSPSFFEGQPNVVIEAAAAKCPLIISSIEAHRDFADENMALFFEPDSPVELANAIRAALDDPASARRRAERAWEVSRGHSAEKAAAGYQTAYENLVQMKTV